MRRVLLAAAGLAVAAAVLAGCGIPTQDAARSFSYHASRTPTTLATARKGALPVTLYFVNNNKTNRLKEDPIKVLTGTSLTSVLAILLSGPTASLAGQGIGTALLGEIRVQGTTVTHTRHTVSVDFQTGTTLSGSSDVAVAQLVYTVAGFVATAKKVPQKTWQITFDFQTAAISVPTPSGNTNQPVTTMTYAALAPTAASS